MIIDSHCHLNYEPMSSHMDETIKRANLDGIRYLLTISTEDKSFKNILSILDKYECVYGSYGIHPHEAKKHKKIKFENIIQNVKKNKKIIGIGESGLDFYYNHSEKKDQIDLFQEHIEASIRTNLPIIVHTRSAEKETFEILDRVVKKDNLKILIHCFTGSKEFAFKLLDLGAYISASGVVTFKKSQDLAKTFEEIPLNRLLVETDSPYLAPEPLRGKPNEPSFIIHTVKFLSDLKKITYENLADSTTQNFFRLFGNLS